MSDLLKLDLGAGPNCAPGFEGTDQYSFDGKVKHVFGLAEPEYAPLPPKFAGLADYIERKVVGYKKWPFADNSVGEARCSHCVEHLTNRERCHFVNELYRVLAPGAGCLVIVPHWGSCRAYGDPTHQWPGMSEFWFYYLDKNWRAQNAPHTDKKNWPFGLDCDFECVWGYSLNPSLVVRSAEFQQFAMQYYKESIWDMTATLKKK